MKRILTTLFLIVVCTSIMFAADPTGSQGYASHESTITDGSEPTAYVEVKVSIGTSEEGGGGEEDAGQKVVVGFKKSELASTADNVTAPIEDAYTAGNSISMELNPDTARASLSDDTPLYAFWQIQSGKALEVSLYTSGPLSNGTGGELAWTVYENEAPAEDAEPQSPGITSSADTEGISDPIYTHDDGIMGNAGSIKLDIVTESYAARPVGTYTGYLYIKVSNPD